MPAWSDHPQSAEGYLYLMKPRVVFAARVNMAAATYPLAVLTYDGVTTGDWEDLEMGMTLVLGTTPGAWDLGHGYVRGDAVHACATSTTISVGYSSRGRRPGELDAQDNAYITVLDLFEVWKRPSKGGSAPQSILKDYGISPHNQHLPVIHCGNSGGLGVLDFVDGSDVLALDFDASGSASTNPTDPGWFFEQWDVKDGTITVGTDTDDAITAEFPPGYRWIKRTGQDNDLRLGLPRRFCVVALEQSGVNAPIQTAYRIRWTRKADGQTLTAELRERIDPADYPPGTVVMLLVKEAFAGVDGTLTGWTTKFAGWLDTRAGTGQAALESTTLGTTITAVDIGGRLKQLRAFPSRMERVAGLTDNSNAMTAATIWRYIWWALVWHTSAPMLSDIDLDVAAGDDYPFSLFSNGGGSFYAVCDTLAKATGRRFTCDSRGRLAVVVDPLRQESADRTSTVQAAIGEADWTSITRMNQRAPVGVLKGAATPVSTTAAASLLTPLEEMHAIAPGLVEGAGSGEEQTGYPSLAVDAVEFQKRLGQDYARRNNPEDRLTVALAHGNDAGIEPAHMQWVTVTASAENSGWMDEALSAARCLPESVEFVLDDDAGALTQRVVVERETVGTPGTEDPSAGIVVTRPVIRQPVLRPVSRAGFVLKGGTERLAFIDETNGYLYYTLNGGVTWARINLGITGSLLDFVPSAFSPLYRETGSDVWLYLATTTRAARVAFNPTLLTATLTNQATYTAATVARVETERASEGLVAIAKAISATQTDIIVTTDGENWGSAETINADGGTYGPPALYVSGKTEDVIYTSENKASGATVGKVSTGGGAFGALSSPNLASHGSAFALHVPYDQPGESIAYFGDWDGANTPRKILRANGSGTPADISPQDGGESWGAQLQRAVDTDPNNRNLIAACLRNGDQVGGAGDEFRLYYALDGGATWQYIADLATTGGDYLANVRVAGDGSGVGWALGVARIVKFDFDGAYQDISGNLGSFSSPACGRIPNLFGF